jgi:hypothetical protein
LSTFFHINMAGHFLGRAVDPFMSPTGTVEDDDDVFGIQRKLGDDHPEALSPTLDTQDELNALFNMADETTVPIPLTVAVGTLPPGTVALDDVSTDGSETASPVSDTSVEEDNAADVVALTSQSAPLSGRQGDPRFYSDEQIYALAAEVAHRTVTNAIAWHSKSGEVIDSDALFVQYNQGNVKYVFDGPDVLLTTPGQYGST